MKKLSENESKKVALTEEELELAQVLEEISQDPRLQDVTVPPSVAQKLNAQIQAYEEAMRDVDSPETTQAIMEMAELEEPEEEKVVTFKKRNKKIYFLVAAVLVLSMGMGTVGFGEDFKWLEVGQSEVESEKAVTVESDTDIVPVEDMDEKAAYAYAKEVLGVPVIQLPRMIEGLKFERVQLYGEGIGTVVLYSWEDTILQYTMIQNYNTLSHNEIHMGEVVESYELKVEGAVILVEYYLESNGIITRKATFVHNNVYYAIEGMGNQEAFEEILKNIIFF